jgi:hypothetical protein
METAILEKQNYFGYLLILYTKNIYFCDIQKGRNMKTISLKIEDSIFGETEKILSGIKKSRNKYINDAISHYNRFQKRQILEKKMQAESDLVKNDSMSILKEFENIDYVD